MTNIFAYIFNNISHLRDCPDAEQRDKIENILKTRREERQSDAAAEVGADGGANVNDRADSICWFCHADVTHLENNKCAGCRKVTQLRLCSLEILKYKTFFQARYCEERCQKADWGRHGDNCVKVQEKIRKKKEKKKAEQET